MRILLVEDDDMVRRSLIALLSKAGHEVQATSNGLEASCQMRQSQFEVLITDIVMPDRDGLEVITEFHRTQPKARIIAASGGGRVVDGKMCLDLARHLGAHHVLSKPFSAAELFRALEAVPAAV